MRLLIARAQGKRHLGLETTEQQLALFDTLPHDTQVRYLGEVIEDLPKLREEIAAMVEAWKGGNADALATLMIPVQVIMVPLFTLVTRLDLYGTYWAVILPTAASAFGVFFLRQFFLGIPAELEEAARIDGAGRWRIFWQIILPLSRPALVTLAMLSFLTNWNDFLWPVYVLFSPENQTLQAGLSTLQSANSVRYDLLMAGAVVASVPVLLLYLVAQRFVIEGVSRSGLKG